MIVQAAAFHRLLANARLFQVGKNAPDMLLTWGDDAIDMAISDGHVILHDSAEGIDQFTGLPAVSVAVSAANTKAMELWFRDFDLQQIYISYYEGKFWIGREDGNGWSCELVSGDEQKDLWSIVHDTDCQVPAAGAFAVNADRLKKLALLKPGSYPLDIIPTYSTALKRSFLLFKAGPTISGAIAVLDRKILESLDAVSTEPSFLW